MTEPALSELWDGVDLFCGAGGWAVAAARLGLNVLGVDLDRDACATHDAAGHPTLRADVSALDPHDYAGVRLLIASPPCPTFSQAGLGSGRAELDVVLRAIKRMGSGEWPADELAEITDERTALVLEPLRWALILRPSVITLEQVPSVLPVWEAMADVLRGEGWSVATGRVSAECHGAPQARLRALLVARLDGDARLPTPTHTRYRKGKPRQEPGRLPWVSMADALGVPADSAMRSNYGTGGDPRNRGIRPATAPATTVTSKVGRNRWLPAWAFDRPATTLVSSFRPDVIAAPGYRKAGDGPRQNAPESVSVSEAALLQTFPPDYPFQGARTSVYRQIGMAIPVVLAGAILRAALDRDA